MSHSAVIAMGVCLVLLILVSAFFSISETALMAVNRYRLRHEARLKKRYAVLVLSLLKRPDRLLGAILIGNTVANILASALATLLAVHFFGDPGVIVSTVILTIAVLIFAEVAPKTFAVLYADRVVKVIAFPISVVLKIMHPMVVMINLCANSFLYMLGIKIDRQVSEPLSREELRSIVYETSGRASHSYQNMLLGILDLNKIVIDDVMIPRQDIIGIDLNNPWETIQIQLAKSEVDWLPVYREHINQMVGFLHLRAMMRAMIQGRPIQTREHLMALLTEPYFVPEGTPLNVQLLNFQRNKNKLALIVNEYGEITGLVTVEDILEEIVGEFTKGHAATKAIQHQSDGSYLVNGSMGVRELNRLAQLELPKRGPRTLNGLITEHLEAMPRVGTCVKIANYPIEIVYVKENRVTMARIFPRLVPKETNE